MAGILGGLLNTLGNLGAQVGEADDINRQQAQTAATARRLQQAQDTAAADRQAAALEKRREFELKQQQANAKKPLGTPYVGSAGKTYQRFYDPVTRQVSEEEVTGGHATETDTEKYVRSLVAIGMPEAEARKQAATKFAPTPAKLDPLEQKKAFWKSIGFTDAQIKRMAGVEGGLFARPKAGGSGQGGGGGVPSARAQYLARRVSQGLSLTQIPMKERDSVVDAMIQMGLTPGTKQTATEKQADDAARTLQPMLNDALKLLEPHKDETGAWSAVKQHTARSVYGAGISPGKDEERILQTVSFLQLLGVQPWTKTGRGRYIFEQIKPHLPEAGDSLGLTYQKIQTLKELIPQVIMAPGNDPAGGGATDDAILKALEGGS